MTIEDARNREKLEADAKRQGLTPTALEMSRAVGTDLIRDLVRDNRRSVHERSGINPPLQDARATAYAKPPVGNNGWADPAPLRNGYDRHIEAQLDAQGVQDRAELERRFGKGGR